MAVLANRPLNAIQGSGLVRLSEENPQAGELRHRIAQCDSEWGEAITLSQMAVRALRSTTGVTSVLVGMRNSLYVDDMLEELKRPCNLSYRHESWQRVKKAFA
jgi:aryl-alcohol dehydrogenase-like predicted oxidoreductase